MRAYTTSFREARHRSLSPSHGSLVYCDPPYEGCTSYPGLPAFDHAAFWATMREWSQRSVVLISEYRAPADFVCIASAPKPSSLAGGDRQTVRTERLFCHASVPYSTPWK